MDEKIVEAAASTWAEALGYNWSQMDETDDTAHGPSRKGLRGQMRAAIEAHTAALAAAGFVIVPRVATHPMIQAGVPELQRNSLAGAYWVMIDAAPDQR